MSELQLKNKTAFVYDYGLFGCIAERLARDFGKVYYFAPRESSFPTHLRSKIMDGIPEVIRVDSFYDYKDKVDLFVFPDVGDGDIQEDLRKQGKRVFGSGTGEKLELDREWFRKTIKKLDLPVINYKEVIGVDNLKKVFEQEKDKWVKISTYRGIGETYHHQDWKTSQEWFYFIAYKLGAYRNSQKFIIEDSVSGVEVGSDWFFNGDYLDIGMYGFEVKNKAYVCKVMWHDDLPDLVQEIDDYMAPMMKKMNVRGHISTELRIPNADMAYYIDATQRFGSPPGELATEMYVNFSEIIWAVAGGEDVAPQTAAKYGAEVFVTSEWLTKDWLKVDFPAKNRSMLKFQNLCKVENGYFCIPQNDSNTVCAALGFGSTVEEAQAQAIKIAESVECEEKNVDKYAFDKSEKYLREAKRMGVGF